MIVLFILVLVSNFVAAIMNAIICYKCWKSKTWDKRNWVNFGSAILNSFVVIWVLKLGVPS
jgi:hypothetical protein